MQKFNLKGHGFLRKTKAFGLASGIVLGATLLIGANTVSADETNSGQPATTMQSGTDTSNLDFSNRQEVDKIENNQTASNNPDSDGYYNSQIKSVEIVKPQSNSMESRIRVEFKDGYKIPDRGEVRLQLSGSANISSVELKSPDRVVLGKVSMTPPSTPVEKDLQKTTSLAEYRKLLETNQAEKLGGPTNILLQFNENFAKLDQNRYAEFVIKSTAEDVNPNSPLYYTKNDLSSNDEFFTGKNGYSPFKSVDTYVALPSVKDKKIKAVDNTLRVFTKKLKPIREGAQAFTLMNGSTNLPVNISGLTEIRFMGPGVVVDSDIFTHDIIRQGGATKPLIESGTRVSLSTKESGALSFDKTFQSGQILDLPIITKRKMEGATNLKPRFSDSDTYVTSDKVDAVYKEENLKVKVIKSSNNEFTFETVGDVNSAEGLETGLSVRLLQNFLGLRVSDNFLNAVGKDKIANFMKDSAATSLTLDESLGLNFTIRRNGADKVIKTNSFVLTKPASGVAYGETTTGTVKVRYVDEAGKEIPGQKTETIAENKPWDTVVTITPKSIDGYTFVKSSVPLKTLVGSGEQVVDLVYKLINKTTNPLDPNANTPIEETVIKEYKPNPKLDPGTQNIVDPGKPRKTQGDKVVDPGKPQVIEVGTKPKVVEEEIPFEKKTRENPNLPEGASKVVQEGKNGKKKTTTTYTLDPKTGKVTPNTPTVETTPPVDQITEIGKGKDKDGDLVVNYIPDPESPQGNETVVDEGKKPKLDVTGKVKDLGKPKVIKVGTKPKVVEEEIPFEKKTRENPNLPEGTSKVVQEGKNGKKKTTTTYTLDPKTGKVTPNTPTVETTPPVDQITEIGKGKDKDGDLVVNYIPDPESPQGNETIVDEGSKPKLDITGKVKDPGKPKVIKVGTKPKVVEEEIPFKETVVENPSKPEGSRTVLKEGKVGKKTTTTTYTLDPKTGKVTPNTTTSTTPPEDRLIEVGTGKNVNGDIVTEYVPDLELEPGQTKVVQNGTPEVKDVTGKVVTPGTPTIIHIGIKPKVVEENIPFEREYKDNPKLPEGVENVIQKGVNGKKVTTTTYTVDTKTGKVTSTDKVDETPVVNEIVERGTGKNITGEIVVNYVPDPELEPGKTKVVQNGTPEVKDVTGKVVTPGKPTIIHVGTKPKVVEEETPFKEETRENKDLPKGQTKVVQEGKVGKKTTTTTYEVDPKTGTVTPTEKVEETPAVNKITEIGTKEEAKPTPTPTSQTPAKPQVQEVKNQLPSTGTTTSVALTLAGLSVMGLATAMVLKKKEQ